MGRRASRDKAMKFLYQLDINKESSMEAVEALLKEDLDETMDNNYIKTVVEGVSTNREKIDTVIEKHLKRWKIGRISKVDLSILRVSIFEITSMKDIPISVSINEAVELAKKYSSDESVSFINGLLSKVVQENKQEGFQ